MRVVRGFKVRSIALALVAMLSLSAWPREGAASDDLAALAKRARSGAGLRVGTWQVQDLVDPPSGSSSVTPSVEGWFQKGLDLHLVLENTVGFWQRKESSTEPAGLGFETERENDTYLVPTMSALKFYPATRPSSPLEPYISAGVGPVLRIQRERVTSTDPLVLPTRATTIVTGLGITTGAGVDWNPGGPFGVRIGGHYQWASFGDNASGKRMYRGPGVNVGVTYSFRYQ